MDYLYRKKGRRYEKIGYPFEGWPADGIWLIHRREGVRSSRWITRIGDVPELYPFAQMQVSHDALTKAFLDWQPKSFSASNLADFVIDWLAKQET